MTTTDAPPLAMCIECEDTEAGVRCADCADLYCVLCFDAQHRAGSRLQHSKTLLHASSANVQTLASLQSAVPPAPVVASVAAAVPTSVSEAPTSTESAAAASEPDAAAGVTPADADENDDSGATTDAAKSDDSDDEDMPLVDDESALMRDAAFIPMRLSDDERSLFNLLDASLNVSEYTDKVDVLSYRSQAKRVIQELHETFSIVSGMLVANDFRKGKRLVQDRKFDENEDFFRQVFEIGRRYKIMNPGMLSLRLSQRTECCYLTIASCLFDMCVCV